jgi:hypothetical protein
MLKDGQPTWQFDPNYNPTEKASDAQINSIAHSGKSTPLNCLLSILITIVRIADRSILEIIGADINSLIILCHLAGESTLYFRFLRQTVGSAYIQPALDLYDCLRYFENFYSASIVLCDTITSDNWRFLI